MRIEHTGIVMVSVPCSSSCAAPDASLLQKYPLEAKAVPTFPLLPPSQVSLLNDRDLGRCYRELVQLVNANDFSSEEKSLQAVSIWEISGSKRLNLLL